jgi:hypothetical protein
MLCQDRAGYERPLTRNIHADIFDGAPDSFKMRYLVLHDNYMNESLVHGFR